VPAVDLSSGYGVLDYLSIPEDSSRRYEIVDGDLFVTPTPRPRHQDGVTNLTILRGPESARSTLRWSVDDATYDVPLADVFQG
jgi:hypothetical protein